MKGSFYCEACGAEVKGRSDSCPSCGRSFLGIRCPRCGKEGKADDFLRGCPDCGYMTDLSASGNSDTGIRAGWSHHRKSRPDRLWPASRYWVLSALIIIGLGIILFVWMK